MCYLCERVVRPKNNILPRSWECSLVRSSVPISTTSSRDSKRQSDSSTHQSSPVKSSRPQGAWRLSLSTDRHGNFLAIPQDGSPRSWSVGGSSFYGRAASVPWRLNFLFYPIGLFGVFYDTRSCSVQDRETDHLSWVYTGRFWARWSRVVQRTCPIFELRTARVRTGRCCEWRGAKRK